MIAEGGNSVEGVWKEKRARTPLFEESEVDSVATSPLGCPCRREKKVRIVGKATTPRHMRIK